MSSSSQSLLACWASYSGRLRGHCHSSRGCLLGDLGRFCRPGPPATCWREVTVCDRWSWMVLCRDSVPVGMRRGPWNLGSLSLLRAASLAVVPRRHWKWFSLEQTYALETPSSGTRLLKRKNTEGDVLSVRGVGCLMPGGDSAAGLLETRVGAWPF